MSAELMHEKNRVVTGFPLFPIIFPFLWVFVDTSNINSLRLRTGVPILFPSLWLIVENKEIRT
jgi:hypothetical protein